MPEAAFEGVAPEEVRHAVTSPKSAQSILNGINVKFLNPESRFQNGLYVTQKGETAIAELAAHNNEATHVIRFSMDNLGQKVLNLADADTAKKWGFSLGSTVNDCKMIATKARNLGYNVIAYPSFRGKGINYVIYSDFDRILHPKMVSPAK